VLGKTPTRGYPSRPPLAGLGAYTFTRQTHFGTPRPQHVH
jgi:hypothetical protein